VTATLLKSKFSHFENKILIPKVGLAMQQAKLFVLPYDFYFFGGYQFNIRLLEKIKPKLQGPFKTIANRLP